MASFRPYLAAVFLFSLAACGPELDFNIDLDSGSRGQKGVLSFIWTDNDVLQLHLFESRAIAKTPLAAGGASAALQVSDSTGAFPTGATVSSSDESVVGIASQHPDLVAISGEPGTADLIVTGADGRELDRVTLTVSAVIGVDVPAVDNGLRTVLVGSQETLHFRLIGASGPLQGRGIASFRLEGDLQSADIPADRHFAETTAFVSGAGGGSIIATAAGLERRVDVVAVDDTQLTRLELLPRVDMRAGSSGVVRVVAFADATPVAGVRCQWTGGSPGVAITGETYSGFTANAAEQFYLLEAISEGEFALTCEAPGGLTSTMQVEVTP